MSDSVWPHRRQPTRLLCPWDSPGKNTGVGCHFLLQCVKVKVKVKSLSRVRLFATPWTAAYQASPSMGFSRQEYWSGVPLTSPIMLALPNYKTVKNQFSSVTQLCPTLRPHGLQYARLPYPSPTPGACSNSCPSHQWCHPTMLSSVIPFSSCLQSFPASGSFLMSQVFASGGQVLELQLQRQSFQWIFRTDFLSDWSPCTPRDSQESSPTAQFKTINSLVLSFLYGLNRTNVWTVWQNKVLIFLYTLENFWDPTLIKKKKMPFCLSSTYSFLGVLVGSEWYSRVYRPSDFDAKVQD